MAREIIGSMVDLIKASQWGFSFLFLGKDKKLAKIYHSKDKSYNVSVILDKSNRIIDLETYEVLQTEPQGVSITKVGDPPLQISSQIKKEVLQIIEA